MRRRAFTATAALRDPPAAAAASSGAGGAVRRRRRIAAQTAVAGLAVLGICTALVEVRADQELKRHARSYWLRHDALFGALFGNAQPSPQ